LFRHGGWYVLLQLLQRASGQRIRQNPPLRIRRRPYGNRERRLPAWRRPSVRSVVEALMSCRPLFRIKIRAQVVAKDARPPVLIERRPLNRKNAICRNSPTTPVRHHLRRNVHALGKFGEPPNGFDRSI